MQISEVTPQNDLTVGQVLGLAGGGSAAAAGVIVALSRLRRRDEPESRIDMMRDVSTRLLDDPRRTMSDITELLPGRARQVAAHARRRGGRLAEEAAHVASTASEEAKAKGAKAQMKLHDIEWPGHAPADVLARGRRVESSVARGIHQARARTSSHTPQAPSLDVEQLQQKGGDLMDATKRSLRKARKSAAPLVASARDRTPHVRDQIADTASDRIQRISEYAADMSHAARDRAAGVDLSAVQSGLEPAAESLREVSARVKQDVAPSVRDAAVQAAAAAIGLWEATRAHAGEIDREDLQSAAESLSGALDRAKAASSAAAGSLTALAREQADEVKERSEDARERAAGVSRNAAAATAETSKDATSALVWAGIAGGVIYYGLLNQDQRQRVDSATRSVYAGVTELIRDIQGYDADFGTN